MAFIDQILLTHPCIDGPWGCFRSLTVVNSAAISIGMHIYPFESVTPFYYYLISISCTASTRYDGMLLHISSQLCVWGSESVVVPVFTPYRLQKTTKQGSSLPENRSLNSCQHTPKDELVLRRWECGPTARRLYAALLSGPQATGYPVSASVWLGYSMSVWRV